MSPGIARRAPDDSLSPPMRLRGVPYRFTYDQHALDQWFPKGGKFPPRGEYEGLKGGMVTEENT